MNTPRKFATATVHALKDGLQNVVANLGTDRDKTSHSKYTATRLSEQDLQEQYRAAWLPRKVVDIPAEDSCRNWREWKGDAGDVEKVEELERVLNVRGAILEARKKARLFGGDAIYLGTNAADASEPLNTETEEVKRLTVLNARELTPGDLDRDIESEYFNKPSMYTVAESAAEIHPSRLVIFHGVPIPDPHISGSHISTGWGDSVLTSVHEAIINADSTALNVASLVYEAKVDVIKIPEFMNSLDDKDYEATLLKRLGLAAKAKGINGALLLDTEEEYEQKNANFANLPDVVLTMLQIVSGASDIPMTRLVGMSPGGLNSTGEGDIRNYYDGIASQQTLVIQPAMLRLDQILARQGAGKKFNDGISYEWRTLWQSTAKEEAENADKYSQVVERLAKTKLFDEDSLAQASIAMLAEREILLGLESTDFDNEEDGDEPDASGLPMVADGVPRPLYVSRKVVNRRDFERWAEAQGIELLDDLHVTIAFSRASVDWMAVRAEWNVDKDGRMHIEPGGPRDLAVQGVAPQPEVIVVEFNNTSLQWRHEDLCEAGASWDFENYQPHVTVALAEGVDVSELEPYRGPIVLGPEIFEELNTNYRQGGSDG